MSPKQYIQAVKDRLVSEDIVNDYVIVREQVLASNAQIRARVTFMDGSSLEFSEYLRLDDQGDLEVVSYSYHWMDADNHLRMRWDNAELYPDLDGFPHHVHDREERNVQPCGPMDLLKVLDHVSARLQT